MARPLRIEFPDAVYHVTSRGLGRRPIVRDDDDRESWLRLLGEAATRCEWRVYAWALLTREFHVVVRTPRANLSAGMHVLKASYMNGFNARHRRSGGLFYDRFKAVLAERGRYEWELSRYVHLSPVRAGLADEPEAYRWSSCQAYFDSRLAPEWLAWEEVLEQDGGTLRAARRRYKACLDEGVASPPRSPLEDVVASTLLGSPGFVERVKGWLADGQLPKARTRRPSVSLAAVERAVCEAYGVPRRLLRTRGRHHNEPRQVAVYLSRRLTTQPLTALGERFGGVTPAAVARIVQSLADRLLREKGLATRVHRLEERLRKRRTKPT